MSEKKILVEAKPNARENKIEKITDQVYKVWVKAPAQEGRANKLLIKLLAEYFQVSQSQVAIKAGKTAKTKVIIVFK